MKDTNLLRGMLIGIAGSAAVLILALLANTTVIQVAGPEPASAPRALEKEPERTSVQEETWINEWVEEVGGSEAEARCLWGYSVAYFNGSEESLMDAIHALGPDPVTLAITEANPDVFECFEY